MTAEALRVASSVSTERLEHPAHVAVPRHGRRVEVVALAALVHHRESGARRQQRCDVTDDHDIEVKVERRAGEQLRSEELDLGPPSGPALA
jgi:hypothetical protein